MRLKSSGYNFIFLIKMNRNFERLILPSKLEMKNPSEEPNLMEPIRCLMLRLVAGQKDNSLFSTDL